MDFVQTTVSYSSMAQTLYTRTFFVGGSKKGHICPVSYLFSTTYRLLRDKTSKRQNPELIDMLLLGPETPMYSRTK